MKKLLTLFSVLALTIGAFAQQNKSVVQAGNCCTSKYSREIRDNLEIKKLGLEYLRLKGADCRDCNSSMSDYYSIMQILGKQLDGKSKQQIRKIIGPPDAKKNGRYIYFWRDWHDYMYFTFSSGQGRLQWYYALE